MRRRPGQPSGAVVPEAEPGLSPSGTDDVIRLLLELEREAGTPAAAEARQLLADHFEALGFRVTIQRFAFSTGTLNALPVFGAGLGWLAVLMIPLLLMGSAPGWAALVTWLLGMAALTAIAAGIALGWAPARGERREDANLIVQRPDAEVERWIVAHVDTKAQRQSMAGRLVTLAITALAMLVMLALAAMRLGMVPPPAWVAGAAGLTLAASVLCTRARLRGRTIGAVDNGSGLTAALCAAETSDERAGFIFTGAEEFGLVGSRILAQQNPGLVRGRDVINIDTVDDIGDVTIVAHDREGERLAERLRQALDSPGYVVRRRRLPPGIMVDSLAFARVGARAVTVARLNWTTLRRVHTDRDNVAALPLIAARRLGAMLAHPR